MPPHLPRLPSTQEARASKYRHAYEARSKTLLADKMYQKITVLISVCAFCLYIFAVVGVWAESESHLVCAICNLAYLSSLGASVSGLSLIAFDQFIECKQISRRVRVACLLLVAAPLLHWLYVVITIIIMLPKAFINW